MSEVDMPPCAHCGAPVDGPVCRKCGAAQHLPAPVFLAGRVMGPTAWLLLALLLLAVTGGAALVGVSIMAFRSMLPAPRESGANLGQATQSLARLLSASHPEVEVVSLDHKSNRVTLRERKTGRMITTDTDSARAGTFSFEAGTIASLEPPPADFSAPQRQPVVVTDIEAPLKVPQWIPVYPFSQPHGSLATPGGGTFRFRTSDSVREVLAFYAEALKRSEFEITASGTHDEGHGLLGTLNATDPRNGRSVVVNIAAGSEGTTVTVTFATR